MAYRCAEDPRGSVMTARTGLLNISRSQRIVEGVRTAARKLETEIQDAGRHC